MKYLVVGASGYLGSYMLQELLGSTGAEIIATYGHKPGSITDSRIDWQQLDLTSLAEVECFTGRLNEAGESYRVIYLAAIHHPDEVQSKFNYAWDVNVTALSLFLSHLENMETIYFASTEMVYGASSLGHSFREEDEVNPINAYGLQKTVAEKLVLSRGGNVARFALLMGKGIGGKPHFVDEIIKTVQEGKDMEMLHDTYRNIIGFNSAAKLVVALAEKYRGTQVGIVNIAADDVITKYDMAIMLAEKYCLDKAHIKPLTLENNDFFSARRAKVLCLDNTKVKRLLGIEEIHLEL